MKTLFTLLLLLGGLGAWPARGQAPTFDWAASCGLPGSPASTVWSGSITLDAAGNAYVTGAFAGTARFGATVLTSVGEEDVFVAKLDAAGNYLWAQRAGGSGYDRASAIAVDAEGNAYVTGIFGSFSATFGGVRLFNASAGGDAFVARLEGSTGTWQWAVRAGGTDGENGLAIAVDGAGQVAVTGVFTSREADFGPISLTNAGNTDVFVAKLSAATGVWQWALRAGGTGREGVAGLVVDAVGDVYVAGSFSSLAAPFGATTLTTTYNGTGQTQGPSPNVYVAKVDGTGTGWLWAVQGGQSDGAANGSEARALARDAAGNLYIAGRFRSTRARFGTTVLTNVSWPNVEGNYPWDVFVAKLSGTGDWLWARQGGGGVHESAEAITVDAAGRVSVLGSFSQRVPPVAGAPNSGYYSPTATFGATTLTSAGTSDVFVAQLDAAGNYRWVTQGGGAGGESGWGLAQDVAGRLYCTGTFSGASATFGSWSVAGAGPGVNTAFLARLAASPLAVPAARPSGGLVVWPNPAREAVWVAGVTPGQPVEVIDGVGRRVAQALALTKAPLRVALPASLPKGVYVVRQGRQARRFVVE